MTSVLPITTRNYHAKVVLTNGARVVLREVLFGEQVRLAGGKYAEEVTPMKDGRFRFLQVKHGTRAPVDLSAQHVDRLTRRGATGALGPMARQPAENIDVFDIIQQGLPFSGMIQSFLGRPALHGIDEKTGQERTVLLSEVQLFEAKRRKPEVSRVVRAEVALVETEGVELREVEVTITASELVDRPDAAGSAAAPPGEVREESAQA
jgi:hypothetical protein